MISFICDAMLGRTARFLRLFGFDSLYNSKYSDPELLKIASEERRILLTRDIKLHQKALKLKIPCILLIEKSYIDRIASLVMKANISLDLDSAISRCATCNAKIKAISKEQVKGKIPEKTFVVFNEFWVCTNEKCGKIYYEGPHWVNITKAFKEILRKIEDKRNRGFDNER